MIMTGPQYPIVILGLLVFSLVSPSNTLCYENSDCFNGGICDARLHICQNCDEGFTGLLCETDLKANWDCNREWCDNGGQCIVDEDNHGHYKCKCDPRFKGVNCTDDVDECKEKEDICGPGKCLNVRANGTEANFRGYECVCPPELTGSNCEIKIPPSDRCKYNLVRCLNGGKCLSTDEHAYCLCADGYAGENCSTAVPYVQQLFVRTRDNLHNCGGSERASLKCAAVWGDGRCDPECATEACLFDGFDCSTETEQMCDSTNLCARVYSDGACNTNCATASCGYDGGDCDKLVGLEYDASLVGIQLESEPDKVAMNLRLIEFIVAQYVHYPVSIASDVFGRLIFATDDTGKMFERMDMNYTRQYENPRDSLVSRANRTLIYFDIHAASCLRVLATPTPWKPVYPKCFTDVHVAAAYLSTVLVRKRSIIDGRFAVSMVHVKQRTTRGWFAGNPLMLLICSAAVILVLLTICCLTTVVRQNKSDLRDEKVPVWHTTGSQQAEFSFFPPTSVYATPSPRTPSASNNVDSPDKSLLVQTHKSISLLAESEDYIYEEVIPDTGAQSRVLLNAVKNREVRRVREMLLCKHVMFDTTDENGLGVLHHAVANNDDELLRMLLETNAFDLFMRNPAGQSPLVYAAQVGHPQLDCVVMLTETLREYRKQADRGGSGMKSSMKCSLPLSNEFETRWALVDKKGRSMVHYAALNDLPQLIHFAVANGSHVDFVDDGGDTALHLACRQGNVQAVLALISCHSNIEQPDANLRLPLTLAEDFDRWNVINAILTAEIQGGVPNASPDRFERGMPRRDRHSIGHWPVRDNCELEDTMSSGGNRSKSNTGPRAVKHRPPIPIRSNSRISRLSCGSLAAIEEHSPLPPAAVDGAGLYGSVVSEPCTPVGRNGTRFHYRSSSVDDTPSGAASAVSVTPTLSPGLDSGNCSWKSNNNEGRGSLSILTPPATVLHIQAPPMRLHNPIYDVACEESPENRKE